MNWLRTQCNSAIFSWSVRHFCDFVPQIVSTRLDWAQYVLEKSKKTACRKLIPTSCRFSPTHSSGSKWIQTDKYLSSVQSCSNLLKNFTFRFLGASNCASSAKRMRRMKNEIEIKQRNLTRHKNQSNNGAFELRACVNGAGFASKCIFCVFSSFNFSCFTEYRNDKNMAEILESGRLSV